MKNLKSIAMSVLALGALTWAQAASAASYYVATTGSDSAAGTLASPFKTLQRGITAAAAGDTVIVRDGTYGPTGGAGSMGAVITKAGTSSAWITIKAENKGGAILDCQLTCHSYINLGAGSAYWVIQDFDIRNGVEAGIWANSGGAKNILIKGNHIHHIGNHYDSTAYGIEGIYADGGATNVTVDGNVFNDIGRTGVLTGTHDHGVYTHGVNMVIMNNVFYNILNGWHIQTASGFSGTIANNTFFGPNPYPGKYGQIVIWDPNSNLVIRNNIFYNPNTAAIYNLATVSGSCSIDNNLVYKAGGTASIIDSMPSGCANSGNRVNVDPMLTTPSVPAFDFHLRAGSPAINTGAAFSVVNHDFDGVARPQGAGYDVGAFEYGGTTGPAPLVISAVSASGLGPNGATINWITDASGDSQVVYGPTSAYGSATTLVATLSSSHGVALTGLQPSTLYHYQVKSKNAAGVLTASGDFSFMTAAATTAPGCLSSAGTWKNVSVTSQAGVLSAEFDGVATAKMDGMAGLSNGPASAYSSLAAAVRFNNAGFIDARNGAAYAAAAAVPYTAGTTYHFRLLVNVPAHTYTAFVSQGGSAETLLGGGYAFRTEQAAVSSLNNVGVYAAAGTIGVCAPTVAAATAATPPVISAVASSSVGSNAAMIGWTTDKAADTQVLYGPTAAYGTATPLGATMTTTHSASLSGLTAGAAYHYQAKSRDAAGNLAVSSDFTFTTSAVAPVCLTAASVWVNTALPSQSGSFTASFDAVPSAPKMDGVAGLSKAAAAGYASLAAAVRFNNTGFIDARNGGAYAAAASIPYVAGGNYHFRLVVNVAAHTYSAYVKTGSNPEQLIGGGYAFRSEQATATPLNNLGITTSAGSLTVCGAVAQ